jgi:phosphatidylglycerophosphate synthase
MAPSIWGKLKTTIQFVAILLAILRLGHEVGGMYLDQWVMLIAAAVTVMSAVDYLQRFGSALSVHD